MKRKIIQLAKQTLVVSIPTEIAKKYNIKKKDEIDVSDNGDEIILRTHKKPKEKKIEIDISDMNKKLIKNLLLFTNTLGYDEITFRYSEHKDISFLNELMNQIEGLAIVRQTETSSTFKHISQESPEQFDEILKRAFYVTTALADGVLDIIKKEKYHSLKKLFALENSNNKLTAHCSRILLKGKYKDVSKIPFVFTLTWNLEIIADFYRRICWDLVFNNRPKKILDNKTIKAIEMVNDLFDNYKSLFNKLDPQGIIDLFDNKNKIGKHVEQIFREKKGIDTFIAHYVMDIATYIQDSVCLLLAINKFEKEK